MEEDRQGDLVPRIPHAVSSLIAVHRPDGLFVLSGLEPGLWCVWWHVGSQDWCLGRPILGVVRQVLGRNDPQQGQESIVYHPGVMEVLMGQALGRICEGDVWLNLDVQPLKRWRSVHRPIQWTVQRKKEDQQGSSSA